MSRGANYGPKPWLQAHWDLRAAANFILGGTGTGLLLAAALAAPPAWRWPLAAGMALIAAGLGAVWLEIGRKLRAINVLFNARTSWMTREAYVAVVVFALGLAGACARARACSRRPSALAALGFVYCQGRILFAAKGIPAWRTRGVVALVVATALAEGGGLFVAAAVAAVSARRRRPGWSLSRWRWSRARRPGRVTAPGSRPGPARARAGGERPNPRLRRHRRAARAAGDRPDAAGRRAGRRSSRRSGGARRGMEAQVRAGQARRLQPGILAAATAGARRPLDREGGTSMNAQLQPRYAKLHHRSAAPRAARRAAFYFEREVETAPREELAQAPAAPAARDAEERSRERAAAPRAHEGGAHQAAGRPLARGRAATCRSRSRRICATTTRSACSRVRARS